jgi:hypothetical protein
VQERCPEATRGFDDAVQADERAEADSSALTPKFSAARQSPRPSPALRISFRIFWRAVRANAGAKQSARRSVSHRGKPTSPRSTLKKC